MELSSVKTLAFRGLTFQVSISTPVECFRWRAMLNDTKEPETIRWIDETFAPGDVFVDIGACIGNYSLYAALRHPGVRVFAFEPEPNSFTQLVRNVQLNHLPVTCFLMPLSDEGGCGFFNVNSAFIAGRSQHQFGRTVNARGEPFEPSVQIGLKAVTLDELVAEGVVDPPNHIKIDVDGIEGEILLGMTRLLRDRVSPVRTILCEIVTNVALSNIQGLLEGFGFTCVLHPPQGEGNYVFKRQ